MTRPLATVLGALVLALVVLATAWWSRARDGRRSLAESSAALVRGDRVEAIVHARAAAQARCPWCEAPELGYAKLYAIARDAESKADPATAVLAWQAVRAATLTAAWLDTNDSRRERADQEIARLQHRIDAMSAAAGTTSPAATEERLRSVLAPSPVPSTTFFAVVATGALLFALGAARSIRAKLLRAQDVALALTGGALAVVGVLSF
ncbi:MAG: hypothetical protein KIT84_24900 [Labilithrix sp.]|nr:hypothetical protein [Labilithrix sp.]MCW5814289.1 hypothetical protein [Labilithrix sp.]